MFEENSKLSNSLFKEMGLKLRSDQEGLKCAQDLVQRLGLTAGMVNYESSTMLFIFSRRGQGTEVEQLPGKFLFDDFHAVVSLLMHYENTGNWCHSTFEFNGTGRTVTLEYVSIAPANKGTSDQVTNQTAHPQMTNETL